MDYIIQFIPDFTTWQRYSKSSFVLWLGGLSTKYRWMTSGPWGGKLSLVMGSWHFPILLCNWTTYYSGMWFTWLWIPMDNVDDSILSWECVLLNIFLPYFDAVESSLGYLWYLHLSQPGDPIALSQQWPARTRDAAKVAVELPIQRLRNFFGWTSKKPWRIPRLRISLPGSSAPQIKTSWTAWARYAQRWGPCERSLVIGMLPSPTSNLKWRCTARTMMRLNNMEGAITFASAAYRRWTCSPSRQKTRQEPSLTLPTTSWSWIPSLHPMTSKWVTGWENPPVRGTMNRGLSQWDSDWRQSATGWFRTGRTSNSIMKAKTSRLTLTKILRLLWQSFSQLSEYWRSAKRQTLFPDMDI